MKKRHPAYPRDAEYEVGFGKPPVTDRFVKGRFGNPKRRPKTPKTVAQIVLRLFSKKTISGRSQKVTGLELLLLRQYETAANGDTKALGFLLNMNDAIEEVAEQGTDKKALVEALMARLSG